MPGPRYGNVYMEKRDFIKVRVMPAGATGISGSPNGDPLPGVNIYLSLDDSV